MKTARELEGENYILRRALEQLRDCDWVISLPDRMDAVRRIAKDAIESADKVTDDTPFIKEFYCMDGCGYVVVSEFPTRCPQCAPCLLACRYIETKLSGRVILHANGCIRSPWPCTYCAGPTYLDEVGRVCPACGVGFAAAKGSNQ